ncbi:MAG: helix-turn-helix transcriptional regulator [Methanomethylovorans sp.]|nr:helix-turn-helix transcriptional regulator [Methanomethylovorans sp.]
MCFWWQRILRGFILFKLIGQNKIKSRFSTKPELSKGEKKEKGFNELKRKLKDITPKTLSGRLKELEQEGLIQKIIDDSVFPVRCEYSLTPSGEDFIVIIRALKLWGLKWKFSNKVCESSVCRLCEL